MSKIEQIIGELEDYISSCKPLPLSNTKISVNKDELDEYIRELRLKTPDEIKKYQKLISNKDAILADARAQAEQMIHEAQMHTAELINEHEIMQRAIEQANEVIDDASAKAQAIVDQAMAEANEIRRSSILYTDNMLANLQMLMEHSIENTRSKYDTLINAMSKDLEIVAANRKELNPAPEEESPEELAASVKEVMDSPSGNFEI